MLCYQRLHGVEILQWFEAQDVPDSYVGKLCNGVD